jgi:hypothetical protein
VESRIIIILTAEGELRVTCQGEAHASKVAALGMLEVAKATLMAPRQQAGPPPLLVANGPLPK